MSDNPFLSFSFFLLCLKDLQIEEMMQYIRIDQNEFVHRKYVLSL